MKFKCQSLASAIIADKKSTVTDEQLEDLIFKSMLAEHMDTIVDGAQ